MKEQSVSLPVGVPAFRNHLPVRIRVAEPGQPISDHWLETGAC